MKRLTKNSLLSFLVVALLAIVCAFGVMGFSSNTAKADWQAPDYSAATVAESGFYFEEGAGVRTTTKGIKFQARVTEEFDATGDYTYFATAKVNGGSTEQVVQFSALPEFVDGVAQLNAYINFDNVSEAIWQTALAADWEVNAYAYDGANCMKAANGGEENLRSMRYVATSALLDWTEDAAYDKEDLTSYFTEAVIQEGVNGYVESSLGDFYISLPGAPEDATSLYIDNNLVDADNNGLYYEADIARFIGWYDPAVEAELGTIYSAMMFTEDGGVYATKMAQGTPIASETDMLTYFTDGTNAKAVEGYYYLTADIVMSGTWTYTSQLYGTLDGQGYTISNLKINNGTYGALFDPYGGTVRNIGISIASIGTHMGLVFGEGGDKCDSTVENVAIKVVPGYHTSAIVQLSRGGHHTIKNVILNKTTLTSGTQSTANHYTNGAADKTPATWDIQNVHATANGAAAGPKGVTIYDDFAALKNATDEIRTFEQNRAVKQLKIWITINQENAAEMQNFVAGQHMLLEEDVDVSSIASWLPTQARMGAGSDGRMFIGNGHTVSGINITAHNANPNASFFGGVRGITVRDAGFKFNKVSGNNSGALFSNVTASTNVLQNVMVSVDTFGAYGVGCVARSPEAGAIFNLNDVVFNFGTTSDNPSTPNDQLILGHTGQAVTVNVNKVAIIRPADGLTTLWSAVTASVEPTIYDTLDAFVSGADTDVDLLATAKQFGLIVGINQANAKDMFTAGLGGGYYILEEDVNLDGATISNAKPRDTSKFTGFFNGQGYTVSNVATNSLLAAAMTGKATVKNVGFYGIIPSGTGGVLAGQTNNGTASNILIEDVVVNMHHTEGSYGLLGQSVGMKVTFKNVVVNFENSNSASAGYVGTTSLSGTKTFDKFIGIGSIATITNATSRPDALDNTHTAGFYGGGDNGWGSGYEYGADGTSAPVLGKDLYNFANYAAFEAQLETNAFGLSDNALALIAKTGLVRKITKDNVGILRNVTNGTFYLTEDIDMSQVDLNGDAIVDENDVWTATQARNIPFVGTLDGQGHSITNLKLGGKNYNGFFGTVGGGVLIKNIKIEAASQGHLNATLIGMINTGYNASTKFTLTNGGVAGEVNVVNTVISSKDLAGTKALVTVFYNSVPTIKLTDVVLMTEGTAYDAGYIVTDGGGNTANLTANNVLVVVAEADTSWLADGANTAETVLTGELEFAADTTSVGTKYAENATILGFFGLSPKQ